MHTDNDLLHRFIFDNTDIRGGIITLGDSLNELYSRQDYPPYIKTLIGEFAAAAALISNTLTFDGSLSIQARGQGKVSLIVAEINHNKNLRALAKFTPQSSSAYTLNADLPSLIGDGILSIIIDPLKGNRYQGVVPLDAPTLADCLEHYFVQSEQLLTKLWMAADGNTASGLLLQKLPQQLADDKANELAWENRVQLANTITAEELLQLNHKELLSRLFHEEGVRCFEPSELKFACRCSKQRSSQALKYLGREDAEQLVLEQGIINVDCEFCGFQYTYDKQDVAALFTEKTRH